MKTVYECDYCKEIIDDQYKMALHEKECKKDPINSICRLCARYFNPKDMTLYNNSGKVFGCTRFGYRNEFVFKLEDCTAYILDED